MSAKLQEKWNKRIDRMRPDELTNIWKINSIRKIGRSPKICKDKLQSTTETKWYTGGSDI